MIEIRFDIIGAIVQYIDINTTDTPEEFVEKLTNTTYLTSIRSKEVRDAKTMEIVGIIREQGVEDYTEYTEYKLLDIYLNDEEE